MKLFNFTQIRGLLLGILVATNALAQEQDNVSSTGAVIDVDLTVEADLEYRKRTKYFHNIHCPKRKTKNKGDGSETVSISQNEQYEGEADLIFDLNDNHRHKTRHPRTLTIKIESSEAEDGSTTIVGGVSDRIDWKFSRKKFQTQKCKELYTMGKTERTDVKGQLKVGFRVPDNVWLLQIDRGQGSGAFAPRYNIGTDGELQSSFYFGENSQYVWTTPNSIIYEVFDYEMQNGINSDVNQELDGVLNIRFSPLGKDISDNFNPDTSVLEVLETSYENLRHFESSSSIHVPIQDSDLLNNLAHILRNPESLYSELRSVPLMKRFEISEKYFDLSNSIVNVSQLYQTDVRAAATLVAFEVALSYLKDTMPLCATVSWQNGLQDDPTQVLGYSFYRHFLSASKDELESYSFSDFEFFLKVLADLEKGGHSYRSAQTNPEIRSNLNQTFAVLQERLASLDLPISLAKRNSILIETRIGSQNMASLTQVELNQELDLGLSIERDFKEEFIRLLSQFHTNSEETIRVDRLRNQVVQLEESRKRLVDILIRNLSVLEVGTSFNAANDFVANLVEMLIKYGSLETSGDDPTPLGLRYFAPIGNAYMDFKKGPEILNKIKGCVFHE